MGAGLTGTETFRANFSMQTTNSGIECIINQSDSLPGLSMIKAIVQLIHFVQCKNNNNIAILKNYNNIARS